MRNLETENLTNLIHAKHITKHNLKLKTSKNYKFDKLRTHKLTIFAKLENLETYTIKIFVKLVNLSNCKLRNLPSLPNLRNTKVEKVTTFRKLQLGKCKLEKLTTWKTHNS